ncbi:MAG: transporter substrate-binding domain-containing protein [Eubacteriaceae bacterium]|nr:transporter substrate-binding domain-containing protein [Eubacteriaceae bacterium]
MFKKFVSIFLIAILCCSFLAACGGGGNNNQNQGQDEARSYLVGTDTTFAPFEFEDENGNHTGIDIVLLETIGEEMGFEIEWSILGFSAAVTALEAEQVEAVMAGMSITEERKLKYDFTDSYYDAAVAVAVKAGSEYTSLEDLRGKPVVAKNATTGAQYAEEVAAEYELDIIYVDESAIMYQYVESDLAEACFEDYPIVQYEIGRGTISLEVVNQSSYSFPTALAVLKGNSPELIADFNEGLAKLKANGEYRRILDSFFNPQK